MATRKAGKIYIGVGGWNFAPWRGSFYPKGLAHARELEYASGKLTSIEINSTFYRLQKPAVFQKWRDETPDGFVFSVKAPRFVTNRRDLAEAGSAVEKFLSSGVLKLGDKLGAINWQLAPTKQLELQEIAAFLELLPRKAEGRKLRHALEVRHESFDDEKLVDLLARHGVALVEAGDSAYPHIEARTAPFSYLRVMGSKAGQAKGYSAAGLRRWRERAESLAKDGDVYFYFISGAKQRNPLAAIALLEMGSGPISR